MSRTERSRVCEVWTTTTDRLRPHHLVVLDENERARADRYRLREDRDRSLLAATLLRLVAARSLSSTNAPDTAAARAIRVVRACGVCGGPHGKPSVGSGLYLSLSHAGAVVVVAATDLAPVGVDVEPMSRGAQAESALRTVYPTVDCLRVSGPHDALRKWTRREAVAKATGQGLGAAVSPPCSLVDLDRPAGYVGALAVLTRQPFRTILRAGDEILPDS